MRVMKTDNAADIRLNAMLGNCIFYISPMYEVSHSLVQKRTFGRAVNEASARLPLLGITLPVADQDTERRTDRSDCQPASSDSRR